MRHANLRSVAVTVALVIMATSSCKTKETDSLPADAVDHQDLLREQKRVSAGEVVGAALQVPKIVLDGRGVTVNGRLVTPAGEIDATKLGRVDTLFSWLKGLREHWKTIHPAESFDGSIELTIDPGASSFTTASVITTAAFSGYPRARMKIGTTAWDAKVRIPELLSWGSERGPSPELKMKMRHTASGYEVAVLTAGPCSGEPSVTERVVKGEGLAGVVDELCTGDTRCHVAIEASADKFSRVASLAAAAFPASHTNIDLQFTSPGDSAHPLGQAGIFYGVDATAQDPNAPPSSWGEVEAAGVSASGVPVHGALVPPAARGAKAKPAQVRPGTMRVKGRLAPEAIDKVVRANLDRFRTCYEAGLIKNPGLAGRVIMNLAIDSSGSVAEACHEGSDIPDRSVARCITREAQKLTFPAPESGSVRLVYPLAFSVP